MQENSKYTLIALVELAIINNSRQFETSWHGLKLRATFRENDDKSLINALNALKEDELLSSWSHTDDVIIVSLSDRQVLRRHAP